MTLSDLSIKNPVFAVMLSTAMIVFGYFGYRGMGISQFPEIDFPVICLSVHGNRPLQELNDIVDTRLKQRIETIPGCGGVMYGGLRPRNMRVWLDNEKLQAFNLDPLDVTRAMRAEHVEKPAGYLQSRWRELNVRVMGEARTPDEFGRMPIVNRNNQIIRLG